MALLTIWFWPWGSALEWSATAAQRKVLASATIASVPQRRRARILMARLCPMGWWTCISYPPRWELTVGVDAEWSGAPTARKRGVHEHGLFRHRAGVRRGDAAAEPAGHDRRPGHPGRPQPSRPDLAVGHGTGATQAWSRGGGRGA